MGGLQVSLQKKAKHSHNYLLGSDSDTNNIFNLKPRFIQSLVKNNEKFVAGGTITIGIGV